METIKIGRSRIKTFLLILGAIGFVVGGVWMISDADNGLINKIIGGMGILFFGAAIPLGIKKIIANEDAAELNNSNLIIEPK